MNGLIKMLGRPGAIGIFLGLMLVWSSFQTVAEDVFRVRGYYITFMRMPVMGLPEWKEAIDCIQQDGGNTLLLWMAGGFRSKKFPITWQYNKEHKNIEHDFGRDLIDYAHQKNIRVLLGLTPFGYDGVNQYPIEHPELKAVQRDGQPASFWGIGSWGYNLCPSKPESQRFMLEYAREMLFDFYPNADGLLIESSDYAICFCPDCREKFFDREFQFVRQISDEVWKAKADATVIVYPHYFSGRKVPGFDVTAAKQPFDPRWTLFFTPHSAYVDAALLKEARTSIYSDDSPALKTPLQIRAAAQRAQQAGINGYVPSLEAFSFRVEHPEGGDSHLVGTRLKPFGFPWLADGTMPYNELLVKVNRTAYREFSKDPNLSEAPFKKILAAQIFGSDNTAEQVEDLLALQEAVFFERSWWSASPLLTPDFLKQRSKKEKWSSDRLANYRTRLDRVKVIAQRYKNAQNDAERELGRIAQWISKQWDGSLP